MTPSVLTRIRRRAPPQAFMKKKADVFSRQSSTSTVLSASSMASVGALLQQGARKDPALARTGMDVWRWSVKQMAAG